NLLASGGVVAHVSIFGEPAFEWVRVFTLVPHDADGHLRGKSGGFWPIESDGSDRVALKALLGLPAQPWRRRLPVLPHRCSFWRTCSTSRRVRLEHGLPPCPHTEIIRHFRNAQNRATCGPL